MLLRVQSCCGSNSNDGEDAGVLSVYCVLLSCDDHAVLEAVATIEAIVFDGAPPRQDLVAPVIENRGWCRT